MLHYCLVSMTLFSFFHILMIFYKVVFPLYAFAYRKKEKYLHPPMAILGNYHLTILCAGATNCTIISIEPEEFNPAKCSTCVRSMQDTNALSILCLKTGVLLFSNRLLL